MSNTADDLAAAAEQAGGADVGIPVILDVVPLAAYLIGRGTVLTFDELAVALFLVPGNNLGIPAFGEIIGSIVTRPARNSIQ